MGTAQRELLFSSHALLWFLVAYREKHRSLAWGAAPTMVSHLSISAPPRTTTATTYMHQTAPTSAPAVLSLGPTCPSLTRAPLSIHAPVPPPGEPSPRQCSDQQNSSVAEGLAPPGSPGFSKSMSLYLSCRPKGLRLKVGSSHPRLKGKNTSG